MSKFSIDGIIVDTDLSTAAWEEQTFFNGKNQISVNTHQQWEHEQLFRSKRGRYYIVHTSNWQGSVPSARFIEPKEAAKWLILNDEELPEDLQQFEGEVTE